MIHRILSQAFRDATKPEHLPESALEERQSWLEWQVLSHEWFPKLRQPPYGDRAIVLKSSSQLIGSVGYVPCLNPFEQIPELATGVQPTGYSTTEFGLFWVVDSEHRRQGYASEAAKAMVDYAFKRLRVKRIIATTDHTNVASQGVMRNIGMKIARNPSSEPPWLQAVGVLENTSD